MKLIESSVQIIEEKDPYKMIELAGRTCYKSENNITEHSAKEFVDRMIKLGHGAMLEHGTIYLTVAKTAMNIGDPIFYVRNKYSKVNEDDLFYYITTNIRVIVENNRLDDLQYQVEPTEHHEIRITAKFICDRIEYLALHRSLKDIVTTLKINLIMKLPLLCLLGGIITVLLQNLEKDISAKYYRNAKTIINHCLIWVINLKKQEQYYLMLLKQNQ